MGPIIAGLGLLLVALLSSAGAAPAAAQARTFVVIAEGLTAPTLSEGIRVVPKMFAPSQLVAACREPQHIRRLITSSSRLELQIGERLPLESLNIVAVNHANVAVGGVPISIEAEDRVPAVLQLRSDDPDLNNSRIFPLERGRFRLRVRTLCAAPPAAELIINGVAVP
jgi:hypothetical protein